MSDELENQAQGVIVCAPGFVPVLRPGTRYFTAPVVNLPRPTVYLALHEDRYPHAIFRTREAAEAWVNSRPEKDYTFTIEELTVEEAPDDK